MKLPMPGNGNDRAEKGSLIHGDRRGDRRYAIELDLRYKLIRRKKVLEAGQGRTLDMSSGGILFETPHALPIGLTVELSITWPVLLRDIAPLKLVVTGRVVRTQENCTAIRSMQHEFRTQGSRDAISRVVIGSAAASTGVQPVVFAPKPPFSESSKVH